MPSGPLRAGGSEHWRARPGLPARVSRCKRPAAPPPPLPQLNSSAFTDGWMMKIKVSDPSQAGDLMSADKYEAHCADGGH